MDPYSNLTENILARRRLRQKQKPEIEIGGNMSLLLTNRHEKLQSWMTIKKTEISAQPEFLKVSFAKETYKRDLYS